MKAQNIYWTFLFSLLVVSGVIAQENEASVFQPIDVFDLEFVSDPQVSPDGKQVIYVRNSKDIMTDRNVSNLWMTDFSGADNHPLTSGNNSNRSPRWSPDGSKLAFIANRSGRNQIYLRWMSNGAETKLTNLTASPGNIKWSPDGKWLAFTMQVKVAGKPFVKMPSKPKGAVWANSPIYIDQLRYRSDGRGYLPAAYTQIFVLSVDGGHPRQLTDGPYNHTGGFSWAKDSQSLIFAANRHKDGMYDPNNSEVYELNINNKEVRSLTDRQGPDSNPVVSPDGQSIAYLGFDDKLDGYHVRKLYVMDRNGNNPRLISGSLDRDVSNIQWKSNSNGLFFQYDDEGNTKIASISLDGAIKNLTNNVGGLSLGRPYGGGTFSTNGAGKFAFTHSEPDHPADLAVGVEGGEVERLTFVNEDLFSYKQLGAVEEIWYESSFDRRKIQGWICKPPNFDPSKKYPLILEIHGGPFSNYGNRFSAEVQLYAAAGYVVLYTNPRGSTSYGKEFGNLIHHNYPGEDHDDLMSGVDAMIEKGYIDQNQLFITGGSGGGVLTAWAIGKTDRFKAAVVAKPVINWYSFVLHADNIGYYNKYWFPDFPWNEPEHYMARSPISLVGNVKTPTLLLTGEQDYRTPISETEQYYAALKLQKVESAMVRIQESGHGIANRPSNLIAKVTYILGWFDKYKTGN